MSRDRSQTISPLPFLTINWIGIAVFYHLKVVGWITAHRAKFVIFCRKTASYNRFWTRFDTPGWSISLHHFLSLNGRSGITLTGRFVCKFVCKRFGLKTRIYFSLCEIAFFPESLHKRISFFKIKLKKREAGGSSFSARAWFFPVRRPGPWIRGLKVSGEWRFSRVRGAWKWRIAGVE